MIRFLIAMAVASFTLVGLAFYLKQPSPEYRALESRAAKVFKFDREHPGVLAPSDVRALGLAVGFHDEDGVRRVLTNLEREAAMTPTAGDSIPRLKN